VIGRNIGRYRVISKLGAGGMGEVYLARDESLDRSVAVKILPPDLVKNDERVRRFIQEAKSASSLNHPHIVTIHEIGEAEVPGEDADAPGHRIHYIAMELVSGHTLKTLIHQEKTDLRTLVRYLAQAADGLAKAHAAGIVHRDLKPENIMVTSDGFAKVVDFGLAKLTETATSGTDLTSAPTALARGTGAGVVLGTVGYMAPEQVQGKTVDHRSDIFSLGCVLYEAATRTRPFEADSDVETLHKILKDAPAPIQESNPDVPADLRRVVRRCLAKSPDRRFQSMKDVALDLAEIDETWETLSASTGSGTASSLAADTGVRTRPSWITMVAALVIGAAGLSFGAWQWLAGGGRSASMSSAGLEMTSVVRIAGMSEAQLSADGRVLAYRSGGSSGGATDDELVVRQMATGQDVVVVSSERSSFEAANRGVLAVAPDSSYVYYASEAEGSSGIHRMPTVGGSSRLVMALEPTPEWTVARQVGAMSLSPDGSRFLVALKQSIVLANADGTDARTIVEDAGGNIRALAWSPDERHVVAFFFLGRVREVMAFDLETGAGRGLLGDQLRNQWVTALAWLPDGTGLVMASGVPPGPSQIWFLSWPDGRTRRITNDTNDYSGALSVSSDGSTITTTLERSEQTYWHAPADQPEAAVRVAGEPPRGVWPLPDGRLLALITTQGRSGLWTMRADGTDRQRLTPERLDVRAPRLAALADVMVFSSVDNDGRTRTTWRIDSNGAGLAEIPDGAQWLIAAISPDGETIYYSKEDPETGSISSYWKRPLSGGVEEPVDDMPVFSPDGRWFFHRDLAATVDVRATSDGRVVYTVTLNDAEIGSRLRWAHTSDALLYYDESDDGAMTLWRQPLDGGAATEILRVSQGLGRVGSLQYSHDGSELFFFRTESPAAEVVQIRNFR